VTDKIEINANSQSNVVESEPKVTYVGFVELIQDGTVVVSVDAVFDFSRVPPECHAIAFSLLRPVRLGMIGKVESALLTAEHQRQVTVQHKPWWKFW
jgi:hypothetical protein